MENNGIQNEKKEEESQKGYLGETEDELKKTLVGKNYNKEKKENIKEREKEMIKDKEIGNENLKKNNDFEEIDEEEDEKNNFKTIIGRPGKKKGNNAPTLNIKKNKSEDKPNISNINNNPNNNHNFNINNNPINNNPNNINNNHNNININNNGPINSFSEIPKDVIERSNYESEVQNVKLNNNVYYNPKYNHPIIGEYTSTNYNPLRFGTGIPGQIKMINENVNVGNFKSNTQTFVTENNYNVGNNSAMNINQSSNTVPSRPVGVQKIDTNESIITEDGVKKKITKVTKYMEDGEIKTEIYKTTL